MGRADKRTHVNTSRYDDFKVMACPDDREYLEPFLKVGSRFNAKAFAGMALSGMLPVGAIVKQFDAVYMFYAGALYEVKRVDDSVYPWELVSDTPVVVPVDCGSGTFGWVSYECSFSV